MTMTSRDVLDVRAKAKRIRRRKRIAYVIYLAIGIFLFFLFWTILSLRVSPWHYDIPPPFNLKALLSIFPPLVQEALVTWLPAVPDANTFQHFIENLFFSERMKERFVHACPSLAEETALITQLPDYCFGYALHLLETTRNILIGAALGTIFGLSLGLGSLVFPKIAQVFTPVASFFGTAPIFIAAPFFVIWFGVEIPLLTTIGLVTFYTTLLMYFFSRRAAENIPVGIVESALTLGGSPRTIFRWVYLPGTVPEIAGGFRIALAGAWGLGVLVEVLGIQIGGGHLIDIWRFALGLIEAPSALVALIMFFGVLAVVVDGILVVIIRFITRWSEAGHRLGL